MISRSQHSQIGQTAGNSDIFQGLVAGAIFTRTQAGMTADDFYIGIGVADTDTQLIPVSARIKNRKTGSDRDFAAQSQAGSYAHHILFSHADFNKTMRVFFSKSQNAGRFG